MSCKNKKSDFESVFLLDFFFHLFTAFFFLLFFSLSLSLQFVYLSPPAVTLTSAAALTKPPKKGQNKIRTKEIFLGGSGEKEKEQEKQKTKKQKKQKLFLFLFLFLSHRILCTSLRSRIDSSSPALVISASVLLALSSAIPHRTSSSTSLRSET